MKGAPKKEVMGLITDVLQKKGFEITKTDEDESKALIFRKGDNDDSEEPMIISLVGLIEGLTKSTPEQEEKVEEKKK